MSIIKVIRGLFKKKEAKVIDMPLIVVGGKECPVCGVYGLFHYPTYSRCEECDTMFDEEMNILKVSERPFRYRDDGGTDGG